MFFRPTASPSDRLMRTAPGLRIVDLANAFHRGDSLGGQVVSATLNEMRGNWVLRFQGDGRPPVDPDHQPELERVREQLVAGIGADAVVEPAAQLRLELEHEAMLAGARSACRRSASSWRTRPSSARARRARAAARRPRRRREAVQLDRDLDPQRLAEHGCAACGVSRRRSSTPGQAARTAPSTRRRSRARGEVVLRVAPPLLRGGEVELARRTRRPCAWR